METIAVQNEALRQELLSDALNLSQVAADFARSTKSLQHGGGRSTGRSAQRSLRPAVGGMPNLALVHPQRQPRSAEDRERARAELREKYEEDQARIQRALRMQREQQLRREEEAFARLYNEVVMEEEDFVSLVAEYCALDDQNRLRKQESLCREWHEKVFDKVQRQISKQLGGMSTREIEERRRKLYDQFLAAANSKESGLFRDIIIENEYDPMIAHAHTIKYAPQTGSDPVKLELNKAAREAQAIPGEFKPKAELGRTTLKTTLWDKLDATPYGRFSKMMTATKADHGTFKTSLQMDHYSFERVRAGGCRAPGAAARRRSTARRSAARASRPRRAAAIALRAAPTFAGQGRHRLRVPQGEAHLPGLGAGQDLARPRHRRLLVSRMMNSSSCALMAAGVHHLSEACRQSEVHVTKTPDYTYPERQCVVGSSHTHCYSA